MLELVVQAIRISRLLRWWCKRLSTDIPEEIRDWSNAPEWPLLVTSIAFFASFLFHWIGYRLAIHRIGWSEPWFAATEWEGRLGWRKPLVFGISNAMVFVSLRQASRSQSLVPRRWVSHLAAWSTAVEVATITLQAWRNEPSHFNTSTVENTLLYSIKLSGALLLSSACIALTTGVILQPASKVSKHRMCALRHGMLLLCVAIAVGIAQVWYGHSARAAREDEHAACLAVTAGASQSPCYEIHGQAVVKLAHFLPLHATEVLLMLAWAIGQATRSTQDSSCKWLSVVATSCWALAILGVLLTWKGEDVKHPSASVAVMLSLSLAPIALAFIAVFLTPWQKTSRDLFGASCWQEDTKIVTTRKLAID